METSAIAGMAMSMQADRLQQAVGTRVLKMQMDSAEVAASALIDMMKTSTQAMERSVNPHLGGMLDVLA